MAEGNEERHVYHIHSPSVHIVSQEVESINIKKSYIHEVKGMPGVRDQEDVSAGQGIAGDTEADSNERSPVRLSEPEEGMKKLSESVFMFTKKPLYPGTRVYRGQQRHIGGQFRELAIKVLPRNEKSDREAGLLLSIEHPNIVRVIETGHCFGTVPESYIAMELCSKNLQEYVNENQRIPFNLTNAFTFSKQLIVAIAYIHERKIVHRDLKPGNILISSCGTKIKVADMGLSKGVPSNQAAAYVTHISAGSDGFKAPETFTNISVYTYSADIFPLGINVYFIFTNGKHPFGDKPHRWAANIEDNRDRDLSQIPKFKNPITAKRPHLVKVIEAMLQPDPTKRPTAEQILKNEFFTESEPMPVTSQIATMAISSQIQGNDHKSQAVKQARIKVLEAELEKPLKEIGYEKSSEILEELQVLRGTGDLTILLQLAECYLHMMSDKKDSSIANVAQFITTLGSQSASDVRKMAYDLKQQGHYVQAIILYKICHDLHKKENKFTPDEELNWIRIGVINIQCAIQPLVIEGRRSREVAKLYGLKYINEMLKEVRAVKNASPDVKALNELCCLVNFTYINNVVGKYGKSVQLGKAGIAMMTQQFGENVSNYKRYGWLLNNLGSAYHSSGQYSKAEHYYVTALEVNEKASDYENEKERRNEIESTKRNLEKTRRRREDIAMTKGNLEIVYRNIAEQK